MPNHSHPLPPLPRRALPWLLSMLIMGALATPTATAQEAEAIARSHFQLGRAYYEAGNFSKAATEFEAAYEVSKRPELLYNIYLAYRDANDMPNAARALREYLDKTSIIENRAQLEARLGIMERDLQQSPSGEGQESRKQPAQPAPVATTPAPAAAQPPAQPPVEAPEPSQPVAPQPRQAAEPKAAQGAASVDPPDVDTGRGLPAVPIALMAGGGAMVLGSLVTGLMAGSAQSELERECPNRMDCSLALEDTRTRGQALAVVTDVLLLGGLAAAGTGLALFLLDGGDQSETRTPTAGLACLPGRCHASVRVPF